MQPTFLILADRTDITRAVADRLFSMMPFAATPVQNWLERNGFTDLALYLPDGNTPSFHFLIVFLPETSADSAVSNCLLRQFLNDFLPWLEHFPAYGDIPLDDITTQTGKVIRHIIDLSMKEQPLFHKEELVILLTVRNNRRLLQNALVCLDEIQRNRYIADSNRLTAYLWILVQPWISFDELSYTLLSVQQTDALHRLAKETSKATRKLKHSDFPLEVDELPALLIKAYITNIN